MRNILVTGGAGFIGTNLIKRLLENGERVLSVDNFTIGTRRNAKMFNDNENYRFIEVDINKADVFLDKLRDEKIDIIYHLAANSDIMKGGQNPLVDHRDTFQTTRSVLELMRQNKIRNLFFASTSAIYGDTKGVKAQENQGGLTPISYYGAAKLASENFISAYSYMNDINALVFRFPNVIGPFLTHGVIFDFVRKLKANPDSLEILGDGKQTKPYILVDDLIDVILKLSQELCPGVSIYNIGVESATSVTTIADIVCQVLDYKNVEYRYTGGTGGWKGDVPKFQYDLTKIHSTGWCAKHTSDEAVTETVKWIKDNY